MVGRYVAIKLWSLGLLPAPFHSEQPFKNGFDVEEHINEATKELGVELFDYGGLFLNSRLDLMNLAEQRSKF